LITPSHTSEFDVDFRLGVVCVQSGPTLVLRDLLAHSGVLVTENNIFAAWTRPGFTAKPTTRPGSRRLLSEAEAQQETDAEFNSDEGGA
jgi:hypothetical protein